MKTMLLFLAGLFLFQGCNNLDFGPEPSAPLPGRNSAEQNPYEFWLSSGQLVYLYEYSARIQCLSITEDSDHSFKVLVNIFYLYSSEPDDQVQFSSSNPNFEFILHGDPGPGLILLEVEKTGYEKKAKFKLSPKFLL